MLYIVSVVIILRLIIAYRQQMNKLLLALHLRHILYVFLN